EGKDRAVFLFQAPWAHRSSHHRVADVALAPVQSLSGSESAVVRILPGFAGRAFAIRATEALVGATVLGFVQATQAIADSEPALVVRIFVGAGLLELVDGLTRRGPQPAVGPVVAIDGGAGVLGDVRRGVGGAGGGPGGVAALPQAKEATGLPFEGGLD